MTTRSIAILYLVTPLVNEKIELFGALLGG